MVSLDVLLIFAVLFCSGILSETQAVTTEKTRQTNGVSTKDRTKEEAAADDDDEIALEDYVDNELPNFSGDVSSALLGDTTGYDVHIEVKIANRSKTKGNKEENIELSDASSSTTSTVSPKNRMKAKKILDLIIEKLKHKKDAKERIDDTTDVEIEDDGDKGSIKAKEKHTKNGHTRTDEPSNEELEDNTDGSKGDIVDSIEKKTDNKGSHLPNLPLKEQDTTPSFKKNDENIGSNVKTKEHKAFSFKTKEPDVDSHVKSKDQEMHLPSKKKDELKNQQHTFNLPPAGKADMKEESFSFKESNPQHMPKTSALPEEDSSPAKTPKPIGKSGENWEGSKYIKIKVSGDEIRIKVPEFLNKTALFSRIIDIIEEDGKKVSRFVKTKTNSVNEARQSLNTINSKLGNNTPPFYKFLLLKKLHKNAGKITQTHQEQVTTDQHLPDAVASVDDTSPRRLATPAKESVNEIDEVSTAKLNPVKEKEAENVDEITAKKKETNSEHQEEVTEKKAVSVSNPLKEESSEQSAFAQGGSMEEKEDLSEKVKLHDNKEEVAEKEKLHEERNLAIESEFNEKVEGNKNNEAFVPNNVASKSFQENLEPMDMGSKPPEITNIKIPDKKVLDIVPEELHIEDVDTSEKDVTVPSKQADIKPSIGRNHKLESTNSNSIMGGTKHVEAHGPKLNPGRLFNDSLFQQAGMESSDNIEGKHKIESPYTTTSTNGELNHHAKLIADKKNEKGTHPIIDVLTFPEFGRDKSHEMLGTNREKPHNMLEYDKLHNMEENKHKSHIAEDKHEGMHELMEDKHEKSPHSTRKEKLGKTHADDSHEKIDSMLVDKDEKPEPIATEKFKPLNNPLPSILFKEILNTDDSVSKLSRKDKHAKKPGKEMLIDDEKPSEKKEKFTEKENDDMEEDKMKITTPEHAHKSVSATRSKESPSKGGNKLDLSDLASLQLQSKDNLEIGGDEGSDEEGTGEDDEYEDASGDDDDIAEMKDGADTSNLSIANLAIWKASEDIHALLHSLTDREHADKVLGNLRNFIRNKHSVEARKRNSFDRILNARKAKGLHLPDPKTKSFVMANSLIPPFVDLKKKSRIPKKPRGAKRNAIRVPKSHSKRNMIKKRRVIEYDKYTNHTGQGLDRLYNQIATANARIPPTFADDQEGWSSDEVTNVMSQLKTTDIDDDMPGGNADSVLNPAFQDIGMASFTGSRAHHIGLPQNGEHAAEIQPMKELIGYQKELRNQMLQSKLLHNKNEIFTKSPVLPEFRKDKVSQVNTASASRKSLSNRNDKVMVDNTVSSVQSQFNMPYNSSSVQFGNGDYIEGSPEYNLNKDNLWWNRSYKRDSIHRNATT